MSEPLPGRRIVLVRHGRTEWNRLGRAQGHRDTELDEVGLLQAKTAAPYLADYRPSLLVASDLRRARRTAEVIGEATGVAPEQDPRLREYAVGDNRMGLTLSEYADRFPDEARALRDQRYDEIPGRETPAVVAARMYDGLTALAARTGAGETAMVVTHGAALRTGLVAFLGLPAEAEHTLGPVDNVAWVELTERASSFTGEPARWRLAAYNRRAGDPDFSSADGVV